MTPEKKTPASQRRQAEGITGVPNTGRSVAPAPEWSRKRQGEPLLRFRGEYVTPEGLHAQAAVEAVLERSSRGGPQAGDAVPSEFKPLEQPGAAGSPFPESPGTHPANRSPRVAQFDSATGELLPCRSLETTATNTTPKGLTGTRKKVARTLAENVRHLCETHGIERIGFFTLTFADQVTDKEEAQRRLHSLNAGVLNKRYPHRIAVFERQKNGSVHYHLLVVLDSDIRTGVDFEEFGRFRELGKKAYRTAPKTLTLEWAFLRKTLKKYGFGRHELMPIKSDSAALGQYIGKYIGKGFQFRSEDDKGVRLVRYHGDARRMTCKHTAVDKYSTEWRAKCLTFSRMVAKAKPQARIKSIEDLQFVLCKNWSYKHRDFILRLPPADLTVPF